MNEEMIEILDSALERVRRGAPVPVVLADYTRSSPELSSFLQTGQILSLLSNVTMPPADALLEDKQTFLSHLDNLQQQPVSASSFTRLKGWMSRQLSVAGATISASDQKERRMGALLGKAMVILAVALGALGGTAAAADASLPGSPVYGVKLSIEDLRLGVARESETDVDLYLRFVEERVREMARLVEDGQAPDDAVMQRLRLHLESALQLARQMPEDAGHRQLLRIRETVRAQEQEMARQQEQVSNPLRQHLQDTRRYLRRIGQEIDDGLQEPQTFRWQNRENGPEDVPERQQAGPQPGGQNEEPGPVGSGANGPGPGGAPGQVEEPLCRQNECQPAADQRQEQRREQNQYGQEDQQPVPGNDAHDGQGEGPMVGEGQQGPGHGEDDGAGMGPGPGGDNGGPDDGSRGNGGEGDSGGQGHGANSDGGSSKHGNH